MIPFVEEIQPQTIPVHRISVVSQEPQEDGMLFIIIVFSVVFFLVFVFILILLVNHFIKKYIFFVLFSK